MVTRTIQGYGVNATNLGVLPTPILAKTSPGTTNVYYPIGQLWLNQTTGVMYMYLGQGIWPQVASNAAGDVDEIATQSGTALPVAGVITINGASNQILTSASSGTVVLTLSNALVFPGSISVPSKINVTAGANGSIGQSGAMTAGTITISTTTVDTSSLIFLTNASPGGTVGTLSVGTITNGVSFVINSSSNTDTSKVNWWIIN